MMVQLLQSPSLVSGMELLVQTSFPKVLYKLIVALIFSNSKLHVCPVLMTLYIWKTLLLLLNLLNLDTVLDALA
jgi:hypothetical protein